MKSELLSELVSALDARRAVVLATRLPAGDQALLLPLEPGTAPAAGDWPLEAARSALLEDRARIVRDAAGQVFLRPYNPPVRVIVVGAVHIAAPLAQIADAVGFDVHIVDPRTTFASDNRFPEVALIQEWPDAAFAALRPDHRTAVVTLTHDAKLDEPALIAALRSPAFYVGALGSRRTHAKRLVRLREKGVGGDEIARIHAPVGLDIGARTPAEIAVAIMAEVIAALHGSEEPASAATEATDTHDGAE